MSRNVSSQCHYCSDTELRILRSHQKVCLNQVENGGQQGSLRTYSCQDTHVIVNQYQIYRHSIACIILNLYTINCWNKNINSQRYQILVFLTECYETKLFFFSFKAIFIRTGIPFKMFEKSIILKSKLLFLQEVLIISIISLYMNQIEIGLGGCKTFSIFNVPLTEILKTWLIPYCVNRMYIIFEFGINWKDANQMKMP